MTDKDLPQMTLLPPQWSRLADLSELSGAAIRATQAGNVVHVDAGLFKMDIGPNGKTIPGTLVYTHRDGRNFAQKVHHLYESLHREGGD